MLLFLIRTKKCIHTYIYIKTLNYTTNSPTYFVASAPSSGSFDIKYALIKYLIPKLPEDGAEAPKYVGAFVVKFNVLIYMCMYTFLYKYINIQIYK